DRVDIVATASDSEVESQVFSSQGEESSDASVSAASILSRRGSRRRGGRADATPKLIDTLALIYIAVRLLLIPVTLGDLIEWANNGELVYIRAIKATTPQMQRRLPGEYYNALEASSLLEPGQLLDAVTDLQLLYERECGMQIPELNAPLLIHRMMSELALPLEVYPATKRLMNIIPAGRSGEKGKRLNLLEHPEVYLSSLLVVAVKLLFPFDTLKRYPRTSKEFAATAMDWEHWGQTIASPPHSHSDREKASYRSAMSVSEKDVMDMSTSQLDSYLDFFGQTFIEPETQDEDERYKVDFRLRWELFPVPRTSKAPERHRDPAAEAQKRYETHWERESQIIKEVQRRLKQSRAVTDAEAQGLGREVRRPGSMYPRYSSEEELVGPASLLFQKVADLVGLKLGTLIDGVLAAEKRLEYWARARRKQRGKAKMPDELLGRKGSNNQDSGGVVLDDIEEKDGNDDDELLEDLEE
ncbi:hypothetical protein LTS18_002630, partial [Coniosporium uncinatum]